MITYLHPKLPELKCFIKHDYVNFYVGDDVSIKFALYESTYKNIKSEDDIKEYLDWIFKDPKQVEALLYVINNPPKAD